MFLVALAVKATAYGKDELAPKATAALPIWLGAKASVSPGFVT
jgi:hypothetical protein